MVKKRTCMKSVRITKREYLDDRESWEDKLIEKYRLDAGNIKDSQRNYDGKRYTYDVWLRECRRR